MLVDNIGINFVDAAQWQASMLRVLRCRQWHKLHVVTVSAILNIQAIDFKLRREGGSPVLGNFLVPHNGDVGTVTPDDAYVIRKSPNRKIVRRSTAIIAGRENGQT